jgi:catechol 2,3-dioxygenase-like lactoylglutathione lyase family enzyme
MKWSTEIYTSKVEASKQFYCKYFNFKVKLELEGYVVLQHKDQPVYELLFCIPNSSFVEEIFHPEFQGKGVLFQMEVDNVAKEYEKLNELGLEIKLPLVDEAVNGKHFTVVDPNGILVDVVEFEK